MNKYDFYVCFYYNENIIFIKNFSSSSSLNVKLSGNWTCELSSYNWLFICFGLWIEFIELKKVISSTWRNLIKKKIQNFNDRYSVSMRWVFTYIDSSFVLQIKKKRKYIFLTNNIFDRYMWSQHNIKIVEVIQIENLFRLKNHNSIWPRFFITINIVLIHIILAINSRIMTYVSNRN